MEHPVGTAGNWTKDYPEPSMLLMAELHLVVRVPYGGASGMVQAGEFEDDLRQALADAIAEKISANGFDVTCVAVSPFVESEMLAHMDAAMDRSRDNLDWP